MNTEINFERKQTQDSFATERIDVIHNSLLGTYGNNGEYIITGSILNELLSLKKYVTYQFGNSIYCSAFIKDKKQVDFEVVFSENKKQSVMVSELFLLESVNKVNGYYSNTVKTIVANFEEKANSSFVDTTKKFYNILGSFNDGEMEIEEDFYSDIKEATGIVTKVKLNGLLLNTLKDVHEKDFESIFKAKLKALKQKNNIFGEKVLAEFNSEYSKIERHFFVDEKGKVRYKGLNELLDKCVEMISGTDFTYAAGEQQFRDLISKENNLRIQNSLQNEANAMTAIANASLKNTDTNMQQLLAGLSADEKKGIIVLTNGGAETPYPISKYQTEESFRKSKEEQASRAQYYAQSEKSEPKKEMENEESSYSKEEQLRDNKSFENRSVSSSDNKQQTEKSAKTESRVESKATSSSNAQSSAYENVEEYGDYNIQGVVDTYGANFMHSMGSFALEDKFEKQESDMTNEDIKQDKTLFDEMLSEVKGKDEVQDKQQVKETPESSQDSFSDMFSEWQEDEAELEDEHIKGM